MKSTKEALLISGLIITVIFLTSSCGANSGKQSSVSTSEDVEVIAVADIKVSKLSDVIDNINYTALKDHPDHRAHRIDKVLIEDGLIYIFDYSSGKSLSVYDLKGNFQFAITKPGQGPDQYLEVQDFLIDKGKIEVLDTRGKLIFYDDQGTFERSEKLPFVAQALLKKDDDYLFQTGKIPNELGENGKPCEVVQYNLETKKSECVLEIHNGRRLNSSREKNMLKGIDNDFFYGTNFNDTIYRKQNGNFSPKFIFDFSPNALPSEIFSQNASIMDFIDYLNNNRDKAYHSANLHVNADFLITGFHNNGIFRLIYDAKNEVKTVLKTTSENDVDGGLPLYWSHTVNDNDIIMIIDSDYVLERATKLQKEKSQFNEKEQAFLDFTNEFDTNNPLVMISYHLN
ncbi:6-bladed beta-propeller [Roseivirga sp.]|uniref:6-bladed beta-propeller n=1 Tax=Roseivirga sp. TaxID=1964215 RepID=UPI002B269A0D|nr:6-bladed beta-propeller [Roseivirga sp.]